MRGLHARYGHLNDGKPSVWIGRHALDGALFPLLALVLVFTSQEILARFSTVFWLRVAVSLLVSLSVIRFVARVLSRSEEHTSELQSPCNLVCRLLLEKQKIIRTFWTLISEKQVLPARARNSDSYPR